MAISILDSSAPAFKKFEGVVPLPRSLFVDGSVESLSLPAVAVVGSRRASAYGYGVAFELSRDLARRGWVIVSGLARGIDSAAHEGALAGGGRTIAVLAHGLNHLYPRENRALSRKIVDSGGALVTEYEAHEPALSYRFPQRNRLIAGLSRATVVVQAALKSGSLITAQLALDQNRDVWVVPGVEKDEAFLGGQKLIEDGAEMVRSAEDVLKALGESYGEFPVENIRASWLAALMESGRCYGIEELFLSSDRTLSELMESLEQHLRDGSVIEAFSQQFMWVGEKERRGAAKKYDLRTCQPVNPCQK